MHNVIFHDQTLLIFVIKFNFLTATKKRYAYICQLIKYYILHLFRRRLWVDMFKNMFRILEARVTAFRVGYFSGAPASFSNIAA